MPRTPKKLYYLRCISAEHAFGKQSEEPMHVTRWEIIKPESVEIEVPGEEEPQVIKTVGISVTEYFSYSPKALAMTKDRLRVLGLEMPEDPHNPTDEETKQFLGVVMGAICYSTEENQIDEETKTPIIDPKTEKPMVRYQTNIGQVSGRYEEMEDTDVTF